MCSFLARTASLLLAFGFFFFSSCTTPLLTMEEVRKHQSEGETRKALAGANRLLEEEPENGELLYLKAALLKELAEALDEPSARRNHYLEMRQTLDQIPPEADSSLLEARRNLILSTWRKEQDEGIRLLHRSAHEPHYEEIGPVIRHYENALAINPDSSSTWNLKAMAHYQAGDLQGALSTFRDADSILRPMPDELKEKLAFLLLEEGQLEASISLYEELLDRSPADDRIRHGLVNATILSGDHERSVRHLRELTERDPDNPEYHEALATELFFQTRNELEELVSHARAGGEISGRHEKVLARLEEAEHHYQLVREADPEREEINFVTAAFYKNSAARLFELAETADGELSGLLAGKAREFLLRSIPIWQEVAERNPENPEIWKNIWQIYTHLEMEEEAAEIRSRFNL